MTWEEDLEEKKKRADYAKEMGGIERIAKHYTQGRLTVRERIDLLLDEGSFHETGEITGKVSYDEDGNLKDFIPSNFIFDPEDIVLNILSKRCSGFTKPIFVLFIVELSCGI